MSRLPRLLCWLGLPAALLSAALLLIAADRNGGAETPAPAPRGTPPARTTAEPEPEPPADPFDRYLDADLPLADGFDFPVGNADGKGAYTDPATGKTHHGFYVATQFGDRISLGLHPGEDWNGRGGGNTDQGQPVHAVAAGRAVHVSEGAALWGGVVMIEHLYHENHEKHRIRSLYAHLGRIDVREGQDVERRQVIGTIGRDPDGLYLAHLHLELRRDLELPALYWPELHKRDMAWIREHYAAPTAFIATHRNLPVPQREPRLVLVHQQGYRMRTYEQGQQTGDFAVSFGQGRGRKRRRGDLKTPQGMYFVVERHKGEFGGEFGEYYGGYWIKINYPNPYDAAWGLEQKLITGSQRRQIAQAWASRKLTPGHTRLGGGIGFHGWIEEWNDDGPRHLSWGCVVMHLGDIARVYEQLTPGTMVVIF